MGTPTLRQLLRSLCNNSCWNHAVLWRLRHGSPLSLTWEDGYFDYPKPREAARGLSGDVCCNSASDTSSSQLEVNGSKGSSSGNCPTGLLVAEMSRLQYVLGEGVVGEVAFTGSHYWVSFNDLFSAEVNPKLVPECPDEWLLQLACGIKTILLVSILPHGVLQLGSLEEVSEDIELVAHVRDRFSCLHTDGGSTLCPILKRALQDQSSFSLISGNNEHSTGQPIITNCCMKSEDSDNSMTVTSIKLDKDSLSTSGQFLPVAPAQDEIELYGKDLLESLENEEQRNISLPSVGHFERLSSSEFSQLDMMENKLLEQSCLMEELQAYSECNDYIFGVLEEPSNMILNPHPTGDASEQSFGGEDANDRDLRNFSTSFTFPQDSELHKALVPVFQEQISCNRWSQSLLTEDTSGSSSLKCKKEFDNGTEPSWFAQRANGECLLEAVVANAYNGSDDTSRNISNNFISPINLSRQLVTSRTESLSEASALVGDDALNWSHTVLGYTAEGKNATSSSITLKGTMHPIIELEQKERAHDQMQPRKGQKMSNVSKRRAKTGDAQKSRPRDRQLIQDRVKELRELVPNGAKCSIDGLLDRTIKHMLYLRSVTDQAEKLKQLIFHEKDPRRSRTSTEVACNFQNGTSWAFEFGNASQVCPIVVEDLACPGHLLIEMLCDEQGVFLEIAQVIRGLELTILKGIMESRSNATWAHFIVQASKGFHRLDIFWPLMQLLQRKKNPISSKI